MEVEFFSSNIRFLLLLSILPKFTVETRRDYQDSYQVAPCSSRVTCAVTMGPRLYSAWVTTFPFISILSTYPKFTRIYPFFFPLSTFPKFTRNFGGYRFWETHNGHPLLPLVMETMSHEEGALPAPRRRHSRSKSISKNRATTRIFRRHSP